MSARQLPRWWRLRPTANTAGLVLLLAAMWYAGASQNNGAAYVLFFLLVSIAVVSIPHTLVNLSGLHVTADAVKPAFAGQEVLVPIEIVNGARGPRRALQLSLPGEKSDTPTVDEIPAGQAARCTLRFPARTRGEHEIAGVRLASAYPLGFLQSTRRVPLAQRHLVYPKPDGVRTLPSSPASGLPQGQEHARREGDDFAGVRAYVLGESQRHIDWKAVARGQPLTTKLFAADSDRLLFFDFDALDFPDPEQRLSQLTLWVIEAERASRRYALRLPSGSIAPSSGEAHFHQCLRALALHR